MNKILIGTAMMCVALTGCDNGAIAESQPSVAEQIKKLEDEGKLPKLDRSDDIAGPDTDKNGIRDDIDAYIKSKPYTPEQAAAARQMARSIQSSLLVDLDDEAALKLESEKSGRAVACEVKVFPEGVPQGNLVETYEMLTVNTEKRRIAYDHFSEALNGTVMKSPNGVVCEP